MTQQIVSPDRSHKLRILLWAPIVLLPLITLLAWVAGVGRETPTPSHQANRQLPAPAPPPVHAWGKLDFYEQAARDSAKFTEAIRADQARPTVRDTAEAKVYASLAHLQAALDAPPKPLPREIAYPRPPEPAKPGIPLQPPMARDSDIDHLNNMLDKIIAIQHPEQRVKHPDTMDAHVVSMDTVPVAQALTETKGTLISGETIALRLETDLKVRGWTVPAGTRTYGTVSLENERLRIHIRSILFGTHIFSVNMEAYDLDGQPGIYVPGSLDRDVSKASADEALGTLGVTNLDPSLGAQAAGAGIQAVKTLLTRKVRQVRVVVREGYQLLLK